MKTNIQSKIEQIAEIIYQKVEKYDESKVDGLYSGEFGVLLFLLYYSNYSKEEKKNQLTEIFTERLINDLGTDINMHTFSSGLSGILYLFEFFKEKELLYVDLTDIEKILDDFLIYRMQDEMCKPNIDFMHGALGVALYFLKTHKNEKCIYEIIDTLYEIAEKDTHANIFKWKSYFSIAKGITRSDDYNISLSHGMASIIIFLSRTIKNKIQNDKIIKMLEGAVNYILSQRIDFKLYGSHFPKPSLNNKEHYPSKSRLAWCNGDLGIAFSLWEAGKITDNKEWKQIAFNIFIDSTKRLSFSDSGVIDAWICHGAAGIALIYRRMYLETKCNDFLLATNYWIEQTLKMPIFNDEIAYNKEDHSTGEYDYSLLTGLSGIGLLFLSYLRNDEQDWDSMLLLS